jgi:hypothetical protein
LPHHAQALETRCAPVLGLAVLVEVHNGDELDAALQLENAADSASTTVTCAPSKSRSQTTLDLLAAHS